MKIELKVIITLAVVLLGMEFVTRLGEPTLSADVRNIREFALISDEIERIHVEGGTSVVVIGNSLAREGVDADSLIEGLSLKKFPTPSIFYLTPDASGVNEWAATWRRNIGSGKYLPDWVIVITGPGHLLDHPVRSPERLAAFHSLRGDWPNILTNWLESNDERSRFVLAGVSRLFANRDRIRPLLFYNLVPGFEATSQRLNQEKGPMVGAVSVTGETAERFEFLLDSIEVPPERILLAGVPLPEPYDIPKPILEVATGKGVQVMSSENREIWQKEAFPDGYHLGEAYSKQFTSRLVEKIPVFTVEH